MSWDWDKLKKDQQRKRDGWSEDLEHPRKKPKKELWECPAWVFQIVYIICMIALAIALFFPVRWLHYKFSYEGKVEQKIIEMVKPESLKDQYRK